VDHFLLIILEHDLALAALLQFRRVLLWIQFELGLFLKGHIYYQLCTMQGLIVAGANR
jgi:hypothetical protein